MCDFMCPKCHIQLDEDIFDTYECSNCGYRTSFKKEMEKKEQRKADPEELRELERLQKKYPNFRRY